MFDRIAIILSGICLIHCLLLPGVITLLPLAATSFVVSEDFHLWMLAVVVPTSAVALWPAFRRHQDARPITIATIGITILVIATLTHDDSNLLIDQIVTSVGAIVVAVGHTLNFRLMRKSVAGSVDSASSRSTEGV